MSYGEAAGVADPGGAVARPALPQQRGMRTVLRAGGTYVAAAAVQRMAMFILLPFFTRAMTPAEYGTLGVALSINLFATMLLTFGLELPITRMYFRLASEPAQQKRAMATFGAFLLVAPFAGALILSGIDLALGAPIIPARYAVLALLDAAFTVAATIFPLALLRAEDRLREYVVVSFVLAITVIVLTALFVLGLRWGAMGWLAGIAIADGVTLAVAAYLLPWPLPRNLSRAYLASGLRLGFPMLPHIISQWGLQFSDRAILALLVSRASVGAYSLAINLSVPALVAITAIAQATSPTYGRALLDKAARHKLTDTVRVQVLIIALVTAAVILLGPVIVALFIPRGYAEAGSLIPWIALGYAIWGLCGIPMQAVSILAGRTTRFWPISLAAVGLKVGAMFLLVPSFGLIAAAMTYPAANMFVLVGVSILAIRTPRAHIHLDYVRLAAAIGATTLVVAPVAALTETGTTAGVAARLLTLTLLPIVLFLSPAVTAAERRATLPFWYRPRYGSAA